ncbi:alkaline phosphatase family protein [Rhodococcus sp. SGAir0479]|uniref:alkaline phosphatase family protein n=1 Tax=Rhodococcus sp. SGAir0479 TaxID=2567884 RepID=UPI001585E0CA|nr:alkaline phosphatase family protein [Rhodococcus sp. SGAir0479]
MTNTITVPQSLSLLLAAGTLVAGVATASAGTAAAAPAAVTKTVVIGLDGTMLDQVKSANTPNLHRLIAEGTSGQSSILGHPTISGPSWSTILTGVWHTKHGVVDNSFDGSRYDRYPTAFTRIEQAKPELRTASISTWGGIATIAGSGNPDADVVATTPGAGSEAATDAATATAVAAEITSNGPDFVFTQLDQVDGAGHSSGTAGPEYVPALERVDAEVGKIVGAVDARSKSTGEKWTILVTADHGHKPAGGHGGQSAAEASTFVIARGPGYLPGATDDGYTIADIAPTVLANLGVAQPADLDGAPLAKTAAPATGSLGPLPSWIPTGSLGS